MPLFVAQVGETADTFARYAPLLTFVGTAVFYALMFHVTNRTKQDLKEIKEEFAAALKASGDRSQDEILRVHNNFEDHVKSLEHEQKDGSNRNDLNFQEVRRKMDEMREELHRMAQKFADANTALKLMEQRMDFEFGPLEHRDHPNRKKGA